MKSLSLSTRIECRALAIILMRFDTLRFGAVVRRGRSRGRFVDRGYRVRSSSTKAMAGSSARCDAADKLGGARMILCEEARQIVEKTRLRAMERLE